MSASIIGVTDKDGRPAGLLVEDFERAEAEGRIANHNLDPGADLHAEIGVSNSGVAPSQLTVAGADLEDGCLGDDTRGASLDFLAPTLLTVPG